MPSRSAPLKTVVVDLTPILAGGENGGAKIVAVNLIQHLAHAAQGTQFILLTSRRNNTELSALDASNIARFCIDTPAPQRSSGDNLALRAADLMRRVIPGRALEGLAVAYRGLRRLRGETSLLKRLGGDVLFCPFTAPFFDDGETPFVSIVHDLQYRYLPENFDPVSRATLGRQLGRVIGGAARIICVSDYVRETLIHAGAPADRVERIYTALHHRFGSTHDVNASAVLTSWRLLPGRFLFYPSNFWPHKNHATLIRAFDLFLRVPFSSDLKLVLTGAPGPNRDRVMELVRQTGIGDRIVFPGFLPEAQFATLLQQSLALVFPSLYEGFGMPVLEAMGAGKPVLCSNVTSLPEIASDASLLFDPHDPVEISRKIKEIESDTALRSTLVERGLKRSASFGDAGLMAASYLEALKSGAASAL